MISTASTENSRGTALGASYGSLAVLEGCGMPVTDRAGSIPAQDLVNHRTTAELRPSDFGGHVWLRPAATDVFVPTTGHPAWSPPT